MRFRLTALLIVLLTTMAQAQSALQEMVKTEQAFSKMAEEKNTRDAFMAFIADDGLLFRPGAVNGKKWMIDHPAATTESGQKAGVASPGSLRLQAWRRRATWGSQLDHGKPKPTSRTRSRKGMVTVTVWKKQADGSWKFVVDLGISHPQSGGPQTLWQPPDTKTPSFKPLMLPSNRGTTY